MLLSYLARTGVPCLILGLAGCATASGGVAHHGGVENPATIPANALDCQSRETAAHLEAVEHRRPRAPENLGRYLAANQTIETLNYAMLFDVDSEGRARNIRYGATRSACPASIIAMPSSGWPRPSRTGASAGTRLRTSAMRPVARPASISSCANRPCLPLRAGGRLADSSLRPRLRGPRGSVIARRSK